MGFETKYVLEKINVVLVYTLLVMRLKICLSLPALLNSLSHTVDSLRILRYAKMCVFGEGVQFVC